MRITEIAQQKKNTNRYNVFIDGEFAFGITAADLLYHKLVPGMEIEAKLLDKLRDELEFTKARDTAVSYLSRGPKTAKEVEAKLLEKEFSEASSGRVLELLAKNGYIDDVAFATGFIRRRLSINNYGKRKIVAELLYKGVCKEDIVTAYNQICGEDEGQAQNEKAAARRALEKKLKNKPATVLLDPKEKNRLVAYLARRGFSYDVIKKVLNAPDEE